MKTTAYPACEPYLPELRKSKQKEIRLPTPKTTRLAILEAELQNAWPATVWGRVLG